MRPVVLILMTFTVSLSFGQNSLGFVLNTYRNWGNGITFEEVATEHNGFDHLTSASSEQYPFPSQVLVTPITIGAHYRMCSPDTNSWKSKWSRQLGINLGFSEIRQLMNYNPERYELNAPYTVIYNGDTTNLLVDSISEELYVFNWNRGLQTQVYFGMHRVFPSSKRWYSEFGTDLRFGYGKYRENFSYERNDALVFDSTENTTLLPVIKTSSTETLGIQSVWIVQMDLRASFWLPLDREETSWWLQFSVAAGFGRIHAYNNWHSRVSFIPSFGLHYLFTERKTNEQP